MVWADWMVVALLECKKVEYDEAENAICQEAIVSNDAKWRRIQLLMREKGVNVDITQLRNKWKSTIASYKKVRDWNHGFGNEPYEALDQNQRKIEKLPKDFLAEWIELLDSFYGHRPSINPPYIAEGMENLNVGVNPNVIVDPHE
ncbi:hypothetical protein R1flu_026811 [Riccia fluitans]|uniref:Myb/SANT-like DNA-binding domain-containing protein n=1 Tax=Riccia fluitans TaxID=41844 RepID=A0ABD1XHR6_9MARC